MAIASAAHVSVNIIENGDAGDGETDLEGYISQTLSVAKELALSASIELKAPRLIGIFISLFLVFISRSVV
jgi:hypothetical protein